MELLMRDGDYVPDAAGGFCRCTGAEEVLGRVLFQLTARRGSFPMLPELGSGLYLLPREKPAARKAMAAQYVVQALAGEREIAVRDVELEPDGRLRVALLWQGEPLNVTLEL